MTPENVHPHFHGAERTDPITGHTLTDIVGKPWIQEGDPDEGLRIYFDSSVRRSSCEAIPTEHPGRDSSSHAE